MEDNVVTRQASDSKISGRQRRGPPCQVVGTKWFYYHSLFPTGEGVRDF